MKQHPQEVVRICHFSDLHLPLTKPVPPWRLLGKRSLGWANLRFNRGKTHKPNAFGSLLNRLVNEKCDLVVMTGDLTSLAFEFEFAEVARIFRDAGLDNQKTVIVPGNHDRYAVSADLFGAFERGMADWRPAGVSGKRDYPFVRTVGPVAVIGVDTAVWRNPLRAAGYVSKQQVHRLVDLLEGDEVVGRRPVIAMHHPPFHLRQRGFRDYLSGLDGSDRLVRTLNGRGATVLHGHLHVCSRRRMGDIDVIGVPSAANDTGNERTQLAYYVYTFDRNGLQRAEGVRHWPKLSGEGAFERFELHGEAFAD